MNITNSMIIALLLTFACLAHGDRNPTSSNGEMISSSPSDADVQNDSSVEKTSGFKYLEATIKNLSSKSYDNIDGWVRVNYADPKLVINYHIKEGPEECDKCKLAIYDGEKCSKLKDPYYDSKHSKKDLWKVSKRAVYVTNSEGEAAGFIKVNNGLNLSKNACKFVVLFYKEMPIGCGQLIPEGKEGKNKC